MIIFQTVNPFTTYLDIFIHYKARGKADWEVKRIKKIFKGYTVLNVILHSILVLHFIQIQEQSWWAE